MDRYKVLKGTTENALQQQLNEAAKQGFKPVLMSCSDGFGIVVILENERPQH